MFIYGGDTPIVLFCINVWFELLLVSCPYSHTSLCLGCTLCYKGLPSACLGFFF